MFTIDNATVTTKVQIKDFEFVPDFSFPHCDDKPERRDWCWNETHANFRLTSEVVHDVETHDVGPVDVQWVGLVLSEEPGIYDAQQTPGKSRIVRNVIPTTLEHPEKFQPLRQTVTTE